MKVGSIIKFGDRWDDNGNPILGIVTRIIDPTRVTVRYCYSDEITTHNGYGGSIPHSINCFVVIKE